MVKHKGRKTMKLPRYMNTAHELERLFRVQCHKVGWMVLAKARGMDYKVNTYKRILNDLKNAIEHARSEYTSSNRIHDMDVLYAEIQVLQDFVEKHL